MGKKLQTGEAGEAYIYYRLLTWGYDAHLASGNTSPFDVFVITEGSPIRIQVKTTNQLDKACAMRGPLDGHYGFNTHKSRGRGGRQLYRETDYDIIAFVSLPLERAFFSDIVPGASRYRISSRKFSYENEKRTWEKCLDRL